MKSAVITFPGSNRDGDVADALQQATGQAPVRLWHADYDLPQGTDLVVLPGGFSYGDYLRCGAIAGRAHIMEAVRKHAAAGGLVLGICNGFQILTEAGLLPGALVRNRDLKFVCRPVRVRVETKNSPFTSAAEQGAELLMPVAHGEGCFIADERTLNQLEAEDRVVLRYVDNPNGSLRDIAGILNENRNVMGLMPHPERATEPLMGSSDGCAILASMVSTLVGAGLKAAS